MTLFESIFYGLIQGVSEFLPISSSGHLIIVPYLLGWNIPSDYEFSMNILVQVASLIAVIVYFRRDLVEMIFGFIQGIKSRKPLENMSSKFCWLIILATIPAATIGILFLPDIKKIFSNPYYSAIFLIVTAILLIIGEHTGRKNQKIYGLSWIDALWIGIFQTFALLPGISRSGSTITGGLLRNLSRTEATKFSFILMIPAMFGAGLIGAYELIINHVPSNLVSMYLPAIITSAIISYLSIQWLLRFVNHKSLYWFSGYCFILGILTLIKLSI